MERLLSSRNSYHLARVGIFLITAALIAGMVGCGQPELEYASMVAAGGYRTVGLRADGTVVAVGWDDYGQCDAGNWTDIVQVAVGDGHTVGLKSDGTVVTTTVSEPSYDYGQCDVGDWTAIDRVAAGRYHTVGLKSDGTVIAAGIGAALAKWNLMI